jgi:hypothetical protein
MTLSWVDGVDWMEIDREYKFESIDCISLISTRLELNET